MPQFFLSAFAFVLIAMSFSLSSEGVMAQTYYPECNDGVDNDRDGIVDYPNDADCTSISDTREGSDSLLGIDVTVSDGRQYVGPNRPVTYNVILRSLAKEGYKTVNVDLYLPEGITFQNASNGGYVTNGRIHWDGVIVNASQGQVILSATGQVSEYLKDGQVLTTRAVVDGLERTDTSLVNYQIIEPGEQFRVNIDDGKQYIQPNGTSRYTLTVKNISNVASATDVRVTLPYVALVTEASDYPKKENQAMTWSNIVLGPGETRTFSFTVQFERNLIDGYPMRIRAEAGKAYSVDQTVVRYGVPNKSYDLSMSTNATHATRGKLVTYTITLRNDTPYIGVNVPVTASLPLYSEFVSATEGGTWDGTNVRWQGLQVAPNGKRILAYTIRVRNDAPMGASLLASAYVKEEMIRTTVRVSPEEGVQYAYNDQSDSAAQSSGIIDPTTGYRMPRTGADLSAIAGGILSLIAAGSTVMQRRKFFLS